MIIKHDSVESLDFNGLEIFDHRADKGTGSSLAETKVPSGDKHLTDKEY